MNEDFGEEPARRPVSPLMIVVALGVIAAMLFPFFQIFCGSERCRQNAGQAFGFVIVVMALLALYQIARRLSK